MKKDTYVTSFRKSFGLLLVIVVLSSHCFAQGTNGNISGNVKDASGGAIAAATVTVTRVDTNEQKSAQTDSSGNYSLLALPPAVYDLEVRNEGFNIYIQKGINVDVSAAVQINVMMTVGTTATTVEVAAEAVRVETVNAQVGNVIGGSSMQGMPLNGRSYVDLMALQPGVNSVSSSGATAAPGYASHAAGSISINGHAEFDNGYHVNGGDVEQVRINGAAVIPNMDSISEFKIITNNVDAEYGHYSGGLISVVTKSGTNEFHGTVFEYFRNTTLDARNFFLPTVGQFNRNQFGGTLGGPIKKNKAFFFVDYQGTREVQANNSFGVITVPTLAERAGDFSAATALLAGTVGGPYWAGILSSRLGHAVTDGEAYYTPACNPCVFPGGIIPKAAWDPTVPGLLPNIVSPNNGPGSFLGAGSLADNVRNSTNQGSARFDYNARRWGMLSAYYTDTNTVILRPYGDYSVPSPTSTVNDTVHAQQWNLSDTKTFGSTAVNEFRFNMLRDYTWVGDPLNFGTALGPLGFVTPYCSAPSSTCPVAGGITVASTPDAGTPILGFAGDLAFTEGTPSFDYQTYQDTPQAIDNFSKIFGSHTTKFGVEWQYARFHQRFPAQQANGQFAFDGSETGSAFADFLVGAPASVQQGSNINYDNRKTYVGLYAEDSWKIKSNLTLNYGLRWDFIQNWWERLNATSDTYIPGEQSTVFPSAPLGLVFAGDKDPLGGTIPRGVARTPRNNFAPRIGIAWSPNPQGGILSKLLGSGGKTSIRAAYGIFYTNNVGAQAYAITGQAPFVSVYNGVTPPLLSRPYTDRATGNIEQAPSFPDYVPPPAGTTGNFKGCATCPLAPINWLEPINGDPAWSVYNVTPYSEDYHLSIQRQFGGATVFSVAYVGSQGHHLLSETPQQYGNAALCLQLIAAKATPKCGVHLEQTVFSVPAGNPTICGASTACTVNGLDSPFGIAFAQDELYKTSGHSNYHSLQVSLQHSSGRLSMLASFNYSKTEDDLTYNESPYNPIDRTLSRGLTTFDVPKSFVVSYNYSLPLDRLSKNRWVAGWHLAGIATFANGLPITLSASGDRSLTGVNWEVPLYSGAPLNLGANDPRTGLPYFNTAAFTRAAVGVLNTAGKRWFHGPGLNNFDMSLLKETKITESTSLEFRAEFFNVFNHAQFLNPSGSVTAATFGKITSARDPRIGQLALKFLF